VCSSDLQESFLDAIKAREDQQRFINESRAYANNIVPKARGEAEAILEQANGYSQRVVAQAQGETSRFLQVLAEYRKAPDITRERLYIETMESVLSNSSKVLVDVDNSNNLMYLPLDQLMRSGQAAASKAPGSNFDTSTNKNSGGSIIDRRSRESRTARTR
jgi:membrane protease subunit HflK